MKVEGVSHVDTDDTEKISVGFAARIKESVVLLKYSCQNRVTWQKNPYLGQAGFVRNPKNGAIMLATCKHNSGAAKNAKDELEDCLSPHECVLHDLSVADIKLPNTGWKKRPEYAIDLRGGSTWSNGFDISLGPTINEDTVEAHWPNDPFRQRFLKQLPSKVRPFDAVGDGFRYDVDLKIGIVVFNPQSSKEEAFSEVKGLAGIAVQENYANVTKGIKEAQIEAALGEKDAVMIYTGYITCAGNRHIEYNVNTYKGCSGAIVIVMDRNHHDFGKALAIHAGYKDALRMNIGFKVAGAFEGVEE